MSGPDVVSADYRCILCLCGCGTRYPVPVVRPDSASEGVGEGDSGANRRRFLWGT